MYFREYEVVTTIWCFLIRGILIKIVIRIIHGPVETGNPVENDDGKYFDYIAKSLPNHLYNGKAIRLVLQYYRC